MSLGILVVGAVLASEAGRAADEPSLLQQTQPAPPRQTQLAPGSAGASVADRNVIFPPASRIGLAPPPDFIPSPNFMGFQHREKQALILLAELPGYAFPEIEKQVTAELQSEAGAGVDRQELDFGDRGRGFVLFAKPGSSRGPVLKWTMAAQFGDLTALVTVMWPEALQEPTTEAEIRAALASVSVRPRVPQDELFSVLPFALEEVAGFRVIRVQPGNAAMLTTGPKDTVEDTEQPLLLITLLPIPAPEPAEREAVARRLFGELPGLKELRVMRAEPLRLASQQGYEILAQAKDAKTGTDITAVQWLRFGTGRLLRIAGLARRDAWDGAFQRFRSVRDGLVLK